MALPLSGTLTMNQIRAELGIPAQAPFSLDTAENGGYVALNPCSPYLPSSGNPASISEWYGYNHTINCCGGATCYGYSVYIVTGGDCTSVCGQTPNTTIYTCSSALNPGVNFSFNSNCQAPGTTYSGAMTDGTYCYTFTGFSIDTKTSCATTTTTAPPTTTTTTVAAVCHNFIATATGVMVWTDCCGVNQNQFLIVGDTFCAQVGTVFGSWLDQGTSCNC